MVTDRPFYPPKITQPANRGALARERLFKRLDEAYGQAVSVWIAAPGGSGKTTLVSSWLKHHAIRPVWYQTDEGDNDPATFFHYLTLAVQRITPRRKTALPELSPELLPGLPTFARRYFEALAQRLGGKGVIVLDNLHTLNDDSPLLALLPVMVESLAGRITLLMTSRGDLPDVLVAHRSKGMVNELAWDDVRFTLTEWRRLNSLLMGDERGEGGRDDSDKVASQHCLADGWVTALILGVHGQRELVGSNSSAEIFTGLDEQDRTALLELAFLPYINSITLDAIGLDKKTGRLLATMARRNEFVVRQGVGTFTLHPLFQEFLQGQWEALLSDGQLHEKKHKSADVLRTIGEHEAAVKLYREVGDFQSIVKIIKGQGDTLYSQGRIATLVEWLASLPAAMQAGEPDVGFWQAVLTGFGDVTNALARYERVFEQFLDKGDERSAARTLIEALSLINATWHGNEYYHWVKKFDMQREALLCGLDGLSELRLISTLAKAYFFYGEDVPQANYWQGELERAIDSCRDSGIKAGLLSSALCIVFIQGKSKVGQRYLSILNELELDTSYSPVSQLDIQANNMLGEKFVGDPLRCIAMMGEAETTTQQYGISIFDGVLHIACLMASVDMGDRASARKHLAALARVKNDTEMNATHYYWGSSLFFMLDNDLDAAEQAIEACQEMFRTSLHIPALELVALLMKIEILVARGQLEQVAIQLKEAEQRAEQLMMPAQQIRCAILKAQLADRVGDEGAVRSALEALFALAQRHGMGRYGGWRSAPLSWACRRALELGVNVSYVREYITSQIIWLEPPKNYPVQWPWPLRIHLLGSFRVEAGEAGGGALGGLDRHTHRLLVLLALYPEGLESARAIELLYGDAMPGHPGSAFRKVLQRLRGLLEVEEAIEREQERLRLNPKLCWIDADAFESLLASSSPQAADEALALYRGELLLGESLAELFLLSRRERLRAGYLKVVLERLNTLEPDAGIVLCQQALQIEPLAEAIYQRLITLYRAIGRADLAQASYDQCRRLFHSELGVEPLAATRQALEAEA